LFVLVAAALLAWRPAMDGPVWRVVRLDALLGIFITGLVFAIVLAPMVHLTGGALVATIGFHYISPVMALLGWLLFGPRPRISWHTVAVAFVWPVLWLVYIFTQGAFTHWYPVPVPGRHGDRARYGAGQRAARDRARGGARGRFPVPRPQAGRHPDLRVSRLLSGLFVDEVPQRSSMRRLKVWTSTR
jgi:hypothetical protein